MIELRRNPPLAQRRSIAWWVTRRAAMAVIRYAQSWRR